MSKSAAVIGGGVVGLSCAYYLHRAGHQVTVYEKGGEHHDCCSIGNSGIIVPSHFEPLAAPGMVGYGLRMMFQKGSPFGMMPRLDPEFLRWAWLFSRSCTNRNVEVGSVLLARLHLASRELYRELSAESQNAIGFEQHGLVMLCVTQKALDAEAKLAERATSLGLHVKILDRKDAAMLEPNTQVEAVGGVHFLDDCHIDPPRLLEWLTQKLRQSDVDFRFGRAVDPSQIQADLKVLAAGSLSGRLAKTSGFRMPMQGGKGYSVDFPTSSPPTHCYILVEARVAVTPMADRVRFGGTMEIVGDDLSVNPRRAQGFLNSIHRYLPDFLPDDFRDAPVWAGLRPCSADGLPYLGRPRLARDLIVATGHSMMGVSLAPISGRIVADLASGVDPGFDLSPLRPDRFD